MQESKEDFKARILGAIRAARRLVEMGWDLRIVCDELHANPTFLDALECDESVWDIIAVDVSAESGDMIVAKSWTLAEFCARPTELLEGMLIVGNHFGIGNQQKKGNGK